MENMENMENNNLENNTCVMADPDFNWNITSSNDEAIEAEKEQFQKDLELFKSVTSALNTPEEKLPFILDFYDNVIPDSIWNETMEKHFQTKLQKNLNLNSQRKLNLINYEIGTSKKSLNDVRYMTSNCERSTGWLINEDKDFANEKPELLSFIKVKMYSVVAKVTEEKVQIPFFNIGATLRSMECDLPFLYEYCFYKTFGYLHRKIIRSKEMVPLLESNPSLLLSIVRYRNSEEFGNNPAWNLVIKNQTIVKDIGYFTVSSYTKYIGNIWVDPLFRGKGIMRAMFSFIKNKILPTEDFLFISTKNPTVLNALAEFNHKFIGRDIPYISSNAPYQLKQKLEENYLETVFCIANKDIPSNEAIHEALNGKDLLYSESSFPWLASKLHPDHIGGEDLINMLTNNGPSRLKYICTTNDLNVVPEYYNYYSDDFKNHTKTHLVFEYKGDMYLYPYFDGQLHVPLNNLLSVARKIEDFKIDVFFNHTDMIVTKTSQFGNKVLYKGNLIPELQIEQIEQFFRYIQYGIERINLDQHWAIKIIDGNQIVTTAYHAVEIINDTIKFVSHEDTCVVLHKNIGEVIKSFPM